MPGPEGDLIIDEESPDESDKLALQFLRGGGESAFQDGDKDGDDGDKDGDDGVNSGIKFISFFSTCSQSASGHQQQGFNHGFQD